MRKALSSVARRWVAEDGFWMLYASGPGTFDATVRARVGERLSMSIPFGQVPDTDSYVIDHNGRFFQCNWHPGNQTKGLFLQVMPADATIHFDLRIDGKLSPDRVFIGPNEAHPAQVPFDLQPETTPASDPVIDVPFVAMRPGYYVFRHRGTQAGSFPARTRAMDQNTIQQLRSLGYLR
jgi:hypothetical protein